MTTRKQLIGALNAMSDEEYEASEQEYREGLTDWRGGNGASRTPEDGAFNAYLRTGDTHGLIESRVSAGLTTAPTETGQTDTSAAGYTIPQSFWAELAIALKAYGGIANDFRLVETGEGRPMPWPTINPTAVTASVLGLELTQLAVASPYVFGHGLLNAWTYATSPILASIQLVQDSAFDVAQFVVERVGEAIGREQAAMAISGLGSGSMQPVGIMPSLNTQGTAGTVGTGTIAATGGYVQLATAATVKTFASSAPTELAGNILSPSSLLAMVQACDPAYYRTPVGTAKFYFNAAQAWNLRSVVDSNGRPLINFANGLDADAVTGDDYNSNAPVARLFGFDVVVDNNIPNLTASTTGGPIFGNLGHAMVHRRVNNASIMRLDQRWADYLAVGYIGYVRSDFQPNDLRAAVTVKAAAT